MLIIPINVMAVSSNYQDKVANITQSKTEKNKILRWDGVFYKIFEYETVLGFQNGNLISQGNVKNYAKIKNGINRKDKSKVSKIIFEKLKKKNWKSDRCSLNFT